MLNNILNKRVSVRTLNNGVIVAYTEHTSVGFGDIEIIETEWARARSLWSLTAKILWQEYEYKLDKAIDRILNKISHEERAWWYQHLLDTDVPIFVRIANRIDKTIDWYKVTRNYI